MAKQKKKQGKAGGARPRPEDAPGFVAPEAADVEQDIALGESGKQVLEQIANVRKAMKKSKKKSRGARMAETQEDDMVDTEAGEAADEGDAAGYDSEEEALRRIKAERAALMAGKDLSKSKKKAKADSDEEESDGEEEDEEDEEEAQLRQDEAVLQRLEDFKLKFPFAETLAVVAEEPSEFDDAEDDLKREVEFYNQALRAVKIGRARLDKDKVPHMRPIDYFAEMVKSDEHMARVKQNLLFEKKKIEAFEQRKQQQEFKKYAKKLQAEKQKEKAAWKKRDKELAREFKAKGALEGAAASAQRGSKRPRDAEGGRNGAAGRPGVNKKRQHKNQKFGHGGRSQRKNDAESVGSIFAQEGGRGGKKGRPGKSRRSR